MSEIMAVAVARRADPDPDPDPAAIAAARSLETVDARKRGVMCTTERHRRAGTLGMLALRRL